jgi:hypothetical protein
MESIITSIIDDPRPIRRLYFQEGNTVTAGDNVIDSIVAYQENGEMSLITWFAGIKNNQILYRYNSKFIETVSYYEND